MIDGMVEEVLALEELTAAAGKYLDTISNGPVCNDGTCIRCRIVLLCDEASKFTESRREYGR